MEKIDVDLRESALRLLGQREHSRRELQNKLAKKTDSDAGLHSLLDELERQGLQSDERFAGSFVRSRILRGQGPLRIRQDLRHRGVASELASSALEDADVDWLALAVSVRLKRFGGGRPAEPKEYARQVRFLSYRGFSQDQVRSAIEASDDALV